MIVETAEQYLDIFQGLKDELTTRETPGYIDLNPVKYSYDSSRDDEFVYPEEEDNYHIGGEGIYYQGESYYY